MTNKKLTISQIAKMAGVSKATVSRVLNDYPHIRPELRVKVEHVISQTGYQRSHIARLLASNRTNMIGFVVPTNTKAIFTDPYFPALTQGISGMTNEKQLTLALFVFHSIDDGQSLFNNIFANGMLDGLIITADRKDDIFIPQLIKNEMPFVLVGRPESMIEGINYVDTDNFNGGVMATDYLLERGYRRIGIIGSNKNTSGDDRHAGYAHSLEKHGIPYDKSLVVFGNYSTESAIEGMKYLLDANPDAVFVTSDTMALGALRVLRESGLRVPQDIAVISYDDLPPSLLADPPLTSIQQPIEATGQIAVEILMEILDNPAQAPKQVILPNKLIVRASTQ